MLLLFFAYFFSFFFWEGGGEGGGSNFEEATPGIERGKTCGKLHVVAVPIRLMVYNFD